VEHLLVRQGRGFRILPKNTFWEREILIHPSVYNRNRYKRKFQAEFMYYADKNLRNRIR
jgi:hypothetical protein